jgi:hypothetical protein
MRVGIHRPPPVLNRIPRGPAESAAAAFDSFQGRFASRAGGDADADAPATISYSDERINQSNIPGIRVGSLS